MLGDEQAAVEARGRQALEGEQRAALACPDLTRRKVRGPGVGGPFLGIDVDHVEDTRDAGRIHHIARHGGGEHVDAVDAATRQLGIHPSLQPSILEIAERQRLAAPQPQQGLETLHARIEREADKVGAVRGERIEMLLVRRIVDEAAEMNAMRARQIAEDVPGTDLVALVRRIGNAVRQEQQIAHGVQPSPRTIGGPSRLATDSGRRFQAAMNSRYFGLSGLWSGIAAPGARW